MIVAPNWIVAEIICMMQRKHSIDASYNNYNDDNNHNSIYPLLC